MSGMISTTDAQRLYKEWQDGRLLDNDERQALRFDPSARRVEQTFAEMLRSASDTPPAS